MTFYKNLKKDTPCNLDRRKNDPQTFESIKNDSLQGWIDDMNVLCCQWFVVVYASFVIYEFAQYDYDIMHYSKVIAIMSKSSAFR